MAKGITIKNMKEVNAELIKYGKRVNKSILKEMSITGLKVESKAKVRTSVGVSGNLRSSISTKLGRNGVTVSTRAQYAPFVEYGRKPGNMPPPSSLFRWVQLKLGAKNFKSVAFVIARSIGKKGIKAKPFLFNSYAEEKPRLMARIKRSLKKNDAR